MEISLGLEINIAAFFTDIPKYTYMRVCIVHITLLLFLGGMVPAVVMKKEKWRGIWSCCCCGTCKKRKNEEKWVAVVNDGIYVYDLIFFWVFLCSCCSSYGRYWWLVILQCQMQATTREGRRKITATVHILTSRQKSIIYLCKKMKW